MVKRYIWQEIQEKGFSETHFCQERECPSFVEEVSGYESGKVKVNLRMRFPSLLDITQKTDVDERREDNAMPDWELDLYLHFIAALDLYSGYNKENQKLDLLYQAIMAGKFGERIRDLFNSLSKKEQGIILRNMNICKKNGLEDFHRVFKEMYPLGLIYKSENIIIVYLDMEEDGTVGYRMELLKMLFLPITYSLKIHFKNHIGIIGKESTMKIGKIRIF